MSPLLLVAFFGPILRVVGALSNYFGEYNVIITNKTVGQSYENNTLAVNLNLNVTTFHQQS